MRKGQEDFLKTPIGMVLVVLFTIIIIGGIASQSGFLGEFGKQMDKLFGKKTNTMAYYETSQGICRCIDLRHKHRFNK